MHLENVSKLAIGTLVVLFFAAVFAIAYTGNGPTYFAFLKYVPGGDKTGHTLLMCFLAIVLSWLLSFRGLYFKKVRIYYGVLSVFVFITIEEFLQLLSPNRNFDLIDLAANYLGIVLAFAIIRSVASFRSKTGPKR